MKKPLNAYAIIRGGAAYPNIRGVARFVRVYDGTMAEIYAEGLPEFSRGDTDVGPHACRIGDEGWGGSEPPLGADTDYDLESQPAGNRAGDLPALFSDGGRAHMSFYTGKFRPEELVGKTVSIHIAPDDYRGGTAAGAVIAGGEVTAMNRWGQR